MFAYLRNLFQRSQPSYEHLVLSDQWEAFRSARSASGVRVSERTALSVPAFWRGINLVAGTSARLPLPVYRDLGDRGREVDKAHPAYRLLNRRFNRNTTAYQGRSFLQTAALIHGNGYAWIERDQFGTPVDLYPLDPKVTHVDYDDAGRRIYVTTIDDKTRYMLAGNVLHIRGLSLDCGESGVSVIDYLRDPIALGVAEQVYASRFYKHGGGLSRALQIDGEIKGEEQLKAAQAQLREMAEGLDNAHKIVLLQRGAKLLDVGLDAEKLQLIEARKFSLIDFALIVGVPASFLGSEQNTSYKSQVEERLAFLNYGLDGWLTNWEQEVREKLLSTSEAESGDVYIEFNRDALERGDRKSETERINAQINGGQLTLNQAAKINNLPTFDHEYADVPFPLWAVIEAEKGRQQAEKIAAQAAEQTEQQDEEPEDGEDADEGKDAPQDERLLALTGNTISRWLVRLSKASGSEGFLLADHVEVLKDQLRGVADEDLLDGLAERLDEELGAMSRKDWPKTLTYHAEQSARTWAEEVL